MCWGQKEGGPGAGMGVRGEQDPLTEPLPGLQDGVPTVSQDIAGTKGIKVAVSNVYFYVHPDRNSMPEPR